MRTTDTPTSQSRYLSYLEGCAERREIPGGVVSLVRPDGCRVDAFGVRSFDAPETVLPSDLYDLASLSKVVSTTTCVLALVEDGEVALGTRLADVIPEFRHRDVSVGQLLAHTSGLPGDDKRYKTCAGREDMLSFTFALDLEAAPGTRVSYSDFGFILLGLLVERIAGSLDGFAQERVFGPLGMGDTLYNPSARGLAGRCVPTELTQDRGLVRGVVHDGKAFRLGGVSGNAGVFSTARDLSRFVAMLLSDGALDGARVLSPTTLGLLRNVYTPAGEPPRTLGWICDARGDAFGDFCQAPCLYHTGFTGTSIYVDLSRRVGVVLLTNRIHPTRDNPRIFEIRRRVHNMVLRAVDDGDAPTERSW